MKKPLIWLVLIIFITMACVTGCQNRTVLTGFRDFYDHIAGLEYYAGQKDSIEGKPDADITDKQLVRLLLESMGELPWSEEPPLPWDGCKGYLVFKISSNNEIIASQKYSYWYHKDAPGYLKLEDGWYRVAKDFFDIIATLTEYPDATSDIDPGDAAFLKKHGWTILYKIKSYYGRLPEKFIHESGEYPVALYYAYNNVLSMDVGLDITPYMGGNVTVNLYKLEEPLPDFLKPRQNANRAVIIKDGETIVGAWLDAGRHDAFACSLKGRKMEEITGKSWGEWVNLYINHHNPQEKLISRMTPEKVIRTFFEAIDRKDSRTAHACETRRRLVSYLFNNMDNNRLYNYSFAINDANWISNITRAKVVNIQPYSSPAEKQLPVVKTYVVTVDLNVRRLITFDSGRHIFFITLMRETPTTGWRIDSISSSP